jgi:hypothetical protein
MAFVFQRGLAIPVWAVAFVAVALTAPLRPMPPVPVLLGIAVIALTMMAMIQWRRTSRVPVEVRPLRRSDRAHTGIIMTTMSARRRVRTVDSEASAPAPDDALDLIRMDDDGGWQMSRETAVPSALIPGAREPGMLTMLGTSVASAQIPDGPGTMDAATVAERQREGGGAPNQRSSAERSRWNVAHILQEFLMSTRALYGRRFRTNHV